MHDNAGGDGLPPFSSGGKKFSQFEDSDCIESDTPVIDGIYTLLGKVGGGGMATVYRAFVDLSKFDYKLFYSYSLVKGRSHGERLRKAAELALEPGSAGLTREDIRRILKDEGIPLPGAMVALKLAKENCCAERFESEWKNLLCLNHPHVIKVYGGGRHGERLYYVMELVENVVQTKEIICDFELPDRVKVIIQAGRGLSFLHGNGIIHRDVKPTNMIVGAVPNGGFVTRLSDIGLFRNIEESMGLTSSRSILGTLPYMSPEQVKSPHEADEKSDIYSLGAAHYELLTGKRPFHDKSGVWQLFSAVGEGERPIPPREHMPSIPPCLDDVVLKAMQPDPALRYETVDQLIADIEESAQALESSPVRAAASNAASHQGSAPCIPDGSNSIPARCGRRMIAVAVLAIMAVAAYLFLNKDAGYGFEETVYNQTFETMPGFPAEYVPFEGDMFRWNSLSGAYEVRVSGGNAGQRWVLSDPFSPVENVSFFFEIDFRLDSPAEGPPVEIRLLSLSAAIGNPADFISDTEAVVIRLASIDNTLAVADSLGTLYLECPGGGGLSRLSIDYDLGSETADISISDVGSETELLHRKIVGFSPPRFSVIATGSPSAEGCAGVTELQIERVNIVRRLW